MNSFWENKTAIDVGESPPTSSVAVFGEDYVGLRPIIEVAQGQRVRAGERLFVDRRRPDLIYTSPIAGTVRLISNGRRKSLDSIIIDTEGDEAVSFEVPARLNRPKLQSLLMASGNWQSLRTRPFGRIADVTRVPDAIFITAMDTRPLAGDPAPVIQRFEPWFRLGATMLSHLTDGVVYLCHAADASLPEPQNTKAVRFSGHHPAGLPSTHIHHLHPVDQQRMVWQIGYQDVIAIGCLLDTGRLWTKRVVALSGPAPGDTRLVLAPLGANLRDLFGSSLVDPAVQLLSGSPIGGVVEHFLRRYDVQAVATPHAPAPRPSFFFRYLGVSTERSPRALIPNAAHERAAPCEILAVPFLRAISVGDTETAMKLGALELVEEDLALLNHVDGPGTDYGALLRATLDELEDAL